MVRNEHAESIIKRKPCHIPASTLYLYWEKQFKLVRICLTGIPENCKKNKPKYIALYKCS